ncbi:MAG TPA: PIN domain-containing protein [Solirubrobacterales bacterium]|nr:PIN domain-containing protein [Solirubrobacterales bacterium]
MAIYLDANVLYPWLRFTEPERVAVSIVAHQLHQELLVPLVAVLEAEEELRRRLHEEIAKLDTAQDALERIMAQKLEVFTEPVPDIDMQLALWRERLEEFARVLPLTDEDAQLALRREIRGQRPARPREKGKHGAGGRDAAVWLAILRDHRDRAEPGHLLSGDKKAFSGGKGELHPALAQEVELEGGEEISYYDDIGKLIERLGEQGPERDLDVSELQSLSLEAVKSGLRHSPIPSRALWMEQDPKLRYITEIDDAELTEVLSQRRYVAADRSVLALNTRWKMSVTSFWQPRGADNPSSWAGAGSNEMEGELQLLVEEDSGELRAAELIGAELKSSANLSMMGDGSVISFG